MAKRLSVATLKRHANSGAMSLELIERFGEPASEQKASMQGIRKVLRANTVALVLLNHDGAESECRVDHGAELVEYDGETLTIYNPGLRELTVEEQGLFDELKKKQDEYLAKYPYADTYWMKKSFFIDSSCPWLDGSDMIRGKKYLSWENKVLDCKVRGEAILKYKVHFDTNQAVA